MIFGINTTSDILKLLYIISRAIRRVKFETILKYHEWYLRQLSRKIMLLFVYTSTCKRFVIFTCRYFKLSWNTTALSQSNCRNFSCSSINTLKAFSRILQFSCVLPTFFSWVNPETEVILKRATCATTETMMLSETSIVGTASCIDCLGHSSIASFAICNIK